MKINKDGLTDIFDRLSIQSQSLSPQTQGHDPSKQVSTVSDQTPSASAQSGTLPTSTLGPSQAFGAKGEVITLNNQKPRQVVIPKQVHKTTTN